MLSPAAIPPDDDAVPEGLAVVPSLPAADVLLVEVDPLSAAIVLNTQLTVNTLGQAASVGTAVTLDGTTPLIRENVTIGGRRLVLVSFA